MSTYSVLYYGGNETVTWREVERRPLAAHEVRVRSLYSGISVGTERLFFQGSVPKGISIDPTQPALGGTVSYPLTYGYSLVGVVEEIGGAVQDAWLGRTVFAFHPHATGFEIDPDRLIRLPDGLPPHLGVFLPNLETALHLVLDGRPLVGERVGVWGLGIVGQLLTMLLAAFPLAWLEGYDPVAERRASGLRMGLDAACYPHRTPAGDAAPFDLLFEASGASAALDSALQHTGLGSRVIVGSWYKDINVSLSLGHDFHRNQIEIRSSQVSRLPSALPASWTVRRRLDLAIKYLYIKQHLVGLIKTLTFSVNDSESVISEAMSSYDSEPIQYIIKY